MRCDGTGWDWATATRGRVQLVILWCNIPHGNVFYRSDLFERPCILSLTVFVAGEPSVWCAAIGRGGTCTNRQGTARCRRPSRFMSGTATHLRHVCVWGGGVVSCSNSALPHPPPPHPLHIVIPIQKTMQRFRLDAAERPDDADKTLFNVVY
jgi:hypothetical protein